MRAIITALVLVATMSLVACTPSSQLNETNTLVATRVVAVADRYLDGNGTLRDIRTVIDRERGNIDEDDDKAFFLTISFSTMSTVVLASETRGEDVPRIREARNKVAELAGIRKR